jgi:hypothetical protein
MTGEERVIVRVDPDVVEMITSLADALGIDSGDAASRLIRTGYKRRLTTLRYEKAKGDERRAGNLKAVRKYQKKKHRAQRKARERKYKALWKRKKTARLKAEAKQKEVAENKD